MEVAGDVEPCIAVGRELLRRIKSRRAPGRYRAASTWLPSSSLGCGATCGSPRPGPWQAQLRDEDFVRMIQNPPGAIHEAIEYVAQVAAEKTATLIPSMTNGADLQGWRA